jgi:hypothetical protein
MIVGFVGRKGVGKDTAADVLVQKQGFVRKKFAQPIKDICSIAFQVPPSLFNGPEKELPVKKHQLSPRQMMQLVGTDFFRAHLNENFWIRHFEDWVLAEPPFTSVVVTDIRFQNELDVVKRLEGLVIKIERSSGEGRHKDTTDQHVTESGVEDLKNVDVVVHNDGSVQDLWDRVEDAVRLRFPPKKNI